MPVAVSYENTDRIERDITHGTDGPVTDFVMIMRALRLVAAGADPCDVGNVLHELLNEGKKQ